MRMFIACLCYSLYEDHIEVFNPREVVLTRSRIIGSDTARAHLQEDIGYTGLTRTSSQRLETSDVARMYTL